MSLLARYIITGHSMIPTFQPNDIVLISSLPYVFKKPKIGDIIVFHKKQKTFVKRITHITDRGFIVAGDNKEDSLDSAEFGIVNRNEIVGKVIRKL